MVDSELLLFSCYHGLQHARLPCTWPSPGICPSSHPLNWWCHPTISSSASLFSFCLQSFPTSGSFPVNWLFASGRSIGASVSASVLPMNSQGWFPLGFTGLIPLLSKGLSSVFSNTTVQKHQFFSTQPSSWSNSHLHMILSYTARNGLMEAQRGDAWLWASGKSPSEMCWIWKGEQEFLK